MTVKELSDLLLSLPQDASVYVYDKKTMSAPRVVDIRRARDNRTNRVFIDIVRDNK